MCVVCGVRVFVCVCPCALVGVCVCVCGCASLFVCVWLSVCMRVVDVWWLCGGVYVDMCCWCGCVCVIVVYVYVRAWLLVCVFDVCCCGCVLWARGCECSRNEIPSRGTFKSKGVCGVCICECV